jgi:hypothetical protein
MGNKKINTINNYKEGWEAGKILTIAIITMLCEPPSLLFLHYVQGRFWESRGK